MIQIQDKNLKQIVELKLVADEVKNIEDIEDISISNVNLREEKLNIDLTEIGKMKNLKKLSLRLFEITDRLIDIINNLSNNLEIIEIENSGLIDINDLWNMENLKVLRLSNCIVISIPKISGLVELREIYLNNINIEDSFDITGFYNLEYISLNGSKVGNKKEYLNKLKIQKKYVIIDFKEDNLPTE